MKNRVFKYIVYVLDKRKNQDEFVNEIAKELCYMLEMKDIRYYYGEENAILTFESSQDFPLLSELLAIIMEMNKVPYILLPYTDDKMSFFLPKDVSEHLFNDKKSDTDDMAKKLGGDSEDNIKLDETMFDKLFGDSEDEDDDILKKIYRENESKIGQNSVDQIFDKINKLGIKSLTKQEKQILDNYSKQL